MPTTLNIICLVFKCTQGGASNNVRSVSEHGTGSVCTSRHNTKENAEIEGFFFLPEEAFLSPVGQKTSKNAIPSKGFGEPGLPHINLHFYSH